MLELYVRITNWMKAQEGQDLIEYAVLIGFIALVVWVAVQVAGTNINTLWNAIATAMTTITNAIQQP